MTSIQRWAGVVAVCGAALVCGGDKEEKGPKGKALGPEWEKDGDRYMRKVEGTAKRDVGEWNDSLTRYQFELPHTTLRAEETDHGRHVAVWVEVEQKRGRVQFELDRDEKGRAYRCRVIGGRITYYDFDLDGVFDAYTVASGKIGVNSKHYIMVDNEFIEVQWDLLGFKYTPEESGPPARESLDGKTKYTFTDGKWKGGAN